MPQRLASASSPRQHHGRRRIALPLARRLQDEARFLKSWFDNPARAGAIAPSGSALAAAMAARVDPTIPGQVVELGPGTGPVTSALVDRGIDEGRLVLVEFDPTFCALLARRFPRARIVNGDAYSLARTLRNVMAQPLAAIVSSLPLLNRPGHDRLRLVEQAFPLLAPNAPFIQFTYGITSPIPRRGLRLDCEVYGPVWLNIPPARVWVYRLGDALPRRSKANRDLIDRLTDKVSVAMRHTKEKMEEEVRSRTEPVRTSLRERVKRVSGHKRIKPTLAFMNLIADLAEDEPETRIAADEALRRRNLPRHAPHLRS